MNCRMSEVAPSLDDDDYWVRVVTNTDHMKRRKGGIHHSAFKGSAVAPPTTAKPWSYEVSGRAFSRTADLQQEATHYVERLKSEKAARSEPCSSKTQAAGIGVQRASRIREKMLDGRIRVDVVYTPLDHDKAHSDLVFYGATADDINLIRDFLQDQLTPFKPRYISELEPACRPQVG